MDRIIYAEQEFPWHELLLKCFDWPFLLFFTFNIFLFLFKEDIRKILNKSKIIIKYGDNSIELADLSNQLDKDIDPIKERLEIIESKINSPSTSEIKIKESEKTEQIQPTTSTKSNIPSIQSVKKQVVHSFRSNRYKYRSVQGIMASTGLSEDQVRSALESNPAIGVTTNREGKVLYYKVEPQKTIPYMSRKNSPINRNYTYFKNNRKKSS